MAGFENHPDIDEIIESKCQHDFTIDMNFEYHRICRRCGKKE